MDNLTKYLALLLIGIAIALGILKFQKRPTIHPVEANTTIKTPYQATIRKLPAPKDTKGDPLGLRPDSVLLIAMPSDVEPKALHFKDRTLPLRLVKKENNRSIYQTPPIHLDRTGRAAVEVELRLSHGLFVPKEALVKEKGGYYVIDKARGKRPVTVIKRSPKGYIVSGIEKNATLLLP